MGGGFSFSFFSFFLISFKDFSTKLRQHAASSWGSEAE